MWKREYFCFYFCEAPGRRFFIWKGEMAERIGGAAVFFLGGLRHIFGCILKKNIICVDK
ncbi:hypothetical protein CLOHYLEM_06886 [[Clostridium] hylemonae DSM 15053]|uniref:Uncharacterized protein n=1 Tax=[Clostridium] hylemonae DSM 15053 TaxID=553973 RepID=C0C471_9FIRM|nr:hypothetical protein CLOHYLEM_06886 [[Clostridium] hylemonae DSM 15053]